MGTVITTVRDRGCEHYEDYLLDITDCSFFCDVRPHGGFCFYRKYTNFTMWFLLGLICVENVGVSEGLAP